MKSFLKLFLIINFLYTAAVGQTITSLSPNNFYQGQNFRNIKIYGSNLLTTPNKHVFAVYLKNQISNRYVAILDSFLFPNVPASGVADSISLTPFSYTPISADTGMYDLILICYTSVNPPRNYSYDTLLNAATIRNADGNFRGKLFYDANANKNFDLGDTTTSKFIVYYDGFRAYNIQYDTSCNYFIPTSNGYHTVEIHGTDNMALITDSNQFSRTITNTDITNLDFGLSEGFYKISPDTVYQNDTVLFNLYSRNLFYYYYAGAEIRDSNWNIVYMINGNVIDSNLVQDQVIISFPPGQYYLQLYDQTYYYLETPLTVLPSTTGLDIIPEKRKMIEDILNPVIGDLEIRKKNNKNITYTIYDQEGRICISGNLDMLVKNIRTSILKSGIYFLVLNAEINDSQTIKFIKQ